MKTKKQYSNKTYLICGWIGIIIGSIFTFLGLISIFVGGFILLIFSVPLLLMGLKYKKIYNENKRLEILYEERKRKELEEENIRKIEEEQRRIEEEKRLEKEKKQQEEQRLKALEEYEERKKQKELFKEENKEEYERITQLCKDIHEEYKELLKEYRQLDIEYDEDRIVYILKECYRKLEVIQERQEKYDCYQELFIYAEMEKIEKKAKAFINKYVKTKKEEGYDNDMIDIMQFTDDLDFINGFIYEKDEKLNK